MVVRDIKLSPSLPEEFFKFDMTSTSRANGLCDQPPYNSFVCPLIVLPDQIKSNQTNYFIVRLKVDQRAGQLSLPHLAITKTEKNRTKT